MSQFWSDLVHTLTPYVPGEQPKVDNLVKLNTNENPYPPSQKIYDAIASVNDERLRLYPDPNSDNLKTALQTHYNLNSGQVFVGNGSDEVLAHIFSALLKHDKPLLFPDITYSFYPVYCGLYGIDYQTIPLTENFEINPDDYAIENGGIIFPNPNAPTGRLLALDAIETLLKNNPDSVIVVDEAYIDFGGESAVSLIQDYANLLVVQTYSKSRSLAGLRIGYAMGQQHLIEGLERVKNSFNSYPIDRVALAAGVAAIEDQPYFDDCCEKIIQTRNNLVEFLTANGFEVIPSSANFVFTKHKTLDASTIAQQLREKAIIVRHFKLPRIDQYLRITIGTDEENQALCNALADIIKSA
ncbi:histidinol-phosphate transaminase [Hydrogenovibrio kuenenii]|uniref:histidinol-phosphate transaminase n=1 Tax=Hydrogenovibrio kuenenii TaxID=63658 RepID=UPI000467BF61|nr:histidinol-phosphate transaminase [Hydrogenovibrio kuenenii]